MTDTPNATIPADVGAHDALTFNDDGTITMVEPDGTTTRFGPLALEAYARAVDVDMEIEAWTLERADEYRSIRERVRAADDDHEKRVLTRQLNATKRRDDIEWKRRNATAFVDMMQSSNPRWTPPDVLPQWFGAGGVMRMCLNHWDTVPFRGLAQARAANASPNGNDPTT